MFYETSSKYAGHWVCVVYHDGSDSVITRHRHSTNKVGTIEFFDSYGMTDPEILHMAATSDRLTDDVPYLSRLIQQSGLNFIYNNKRFQSKNEAIATCGRYAALRSRFKDKSMYEFQAMLSNNKYPSDFLVSALTLLFSEFE